MSGYIKASPEALEKMAVETGESVTDFTELLNGILQMAADTSSYWQGDAAETFRNRIKQKNDVVQTILARFKEWTTDLDTMGQVYRAAEEEAEEISTDLDSDVIY